VEMTESETDKCNSFFVLCAVIFSPHQAWDDNLGSPGLERL